MIKQTAPSIRFHFFNYDHLGNVREVVDEGGNAYLPTDYYPYGTPFYNAASTRFPNLQPFKYNGKELDMMHGLNTYDYGARRYYAPIPMWDRVDPLAEKYYNVSPYAYAGNNPVNAIDPDGRNPIYSSKGEYLGMSNEGFTGQIYIYTGVENLDFSSQNINYWTDKKGDYGIFMKTYDEVEKSYTGEARERLVSNVINHVISHFNGTKVFDDKTFHMSILKGGKIGYSENNYSNFTTLRKHNGIKTQIDAHDKITNSYEGTVENFASSVIIHEWYSHGEYKVGDVYKNHYKAYRNVMNDKIFYPNTTQRYKKFVEDKYEESVEGQSVN